jgi:tetratricopeptide (TPR) repeat protein
MRWLWLLLLCVVAFALATAIEPPMRHWSSRKAPAQSLVASILGDSRRLFANHFFIQSDVYLHGGYYPGIFDQADETPGKKEGPSQALQPSAHEHEHKEGEDHDEKCLHDFLGKPRNWIDAFGRHFFPSKHTHLGETESERANAREILPWIKFSADLDPQRVESYTVGAFWLRQIGKKEEALQFLRQGLRANPQSYEILYELGARYEEAGDNSRARNLWELAWKYWVQQQGALEQPDKLAAAEILVHLARLEVREKRRGQAVAYLELLKKYSTSPQQVQKRIEEVKAGLPLEGAGK